MDPTGRVRLGQLAVDLGYVHPDHLQQVLVIQKELAEVGVDVSTESILLELRHMTLAEAEHVRRRARAQAGDSEEARARPAAQR